MQSFDKSLAGLGYQKHPHSGVIAAERVQDAYLDVYERVVPHVRLHCWWLVFFRDMSMYLRLVCDLQRTTDDSNVDMCPGRALCQHGILAPEPSGCVEGVSRR